ncbi:DNA replication protein [Marivibrio halodurans]|uniref:DNA replication protein n=1 Tax=Marivibrio halodurans TaxID=2039722 RepID=A0A8J7UZW9_9PROT|nr:DnaA/Hda family protein [Marivibrio halodurans]MBP5856126.1 DNA replication protein [Marivibrio halodurans]
MDDRARTPRQLPLDLPHRPARGRDDFLLAPCNDEAVRWIDLWPSWPAPALVLHGPGGCGKTHLLNVWATRADAPVWEAGELAVEDLDRRLGAAMAVAVDHADTLASEDRAEAGDALFHLYNMMRERGGHLLLAAREAPARWAFGRADLRSRLAAAPAVGLGAPDDALLAAVLTKLFGDRQLPVGPEVIRYLTARMPRTFAAAGTIVADLDRLALAERRRVTTALARRVLDEEDRRTE